ncbi:MAG: hypothetical protein JW910_06195, partial [Anaerolineae bacterium]|nr:hypothetical protein [Anaerolineae bacterium]
FSLAFLGVLGVLAVQNAFGMPNCVTPGIMDCGAWHKFFPCSSVTAGPSVCDLAQQPRPPLPQAAFLLLLKMPASVTMEHGKS